MNFNIIDQAVKLVRDKFKINFIINQYTIETYPEDIMIGTLVKYHKEPELQMNLTVEKDYASWVSYTDLDYIISERDLQDGSLVDEVIGRNIKSFELDMRQVLRLAFIIYNGIQYGVKGELKKDYIEKGWHPRVVSARMRY